MALILTTNRSIPPSLIRSFFNFSRSSTSAESLEGESRVSPAPPASPVRKLLSDVIEGSRKLNSKSFVQTLGFERGRALFRLFKTRAQVQSSFSDAKSISTGETSESFAMTINGMKELLPIQNAQNSELKLQPIGNSDEFRATPGKTMRSDLVSRASLDNRTCSLVQSVKMASSSMSKLFRLEELSRHIYLYPETRNAAVKENMIPFLLKTRRCTSDKALRGQINECLALLGHAPRLKGRGIRILTIDGGGTRGLVAIEILKKIESLANQEIYKLFDYICGVSTGSVLAAMLGSRRVSLTECEEIYKSFSREMFTQNTAIGIGKLVFSHAYYDTANWEVMLRKAIGEQLMIQTVRDGHCPRMSFVTCLMNANTIKCFMIRNHNLPGQSHYEGTCQHKMWEGIRASSAAPGYYEEAKLGKFILQDGGLICNNPTALALHESKLLWPNDDIQCLLSVGNGRHEPPSSGIVAHPKVSLKQKLSKIVESATGTEGVHTVLSDLLPASTYFRFNPYMSEDYQLDENRAEKWDKMQHEAAMYVRRNELKFQMAVNKLVQPKSLHKKGAEWIQDAITR